MKAAHPFAKWFTQVVGRAAIAAGAFQRYAQGRSGQPVLRVRRGSVTNAAARRWLHAMQVWRDQRRPDKIEYTGMPGGKYRRAYRNRSSVLGA